LLLYLSHLALGVSNWPVIYFINYTPISSLALFITVPSLYVLQIHFCASNNVAEYEALVHGLKLAKEISIWRIICFGDSNLVVHQVSGEWDAKDANMASYHFFLQQLCGFFKGCEFHHIPEQTTTRQIGCQRSAPPSRRFRLECR
jgi:hypothetical protein